MKQGLRRMEYNTREERLEHPWPETLLGKPVRHQVLGEALYGMMGTQAPQWRVSPARVQTSQSNWLRSRGGQVVFWQDALAIICL